jgi:hypothetical protein
VRLSVVLTLRRLSPDVDQFTSANYFARLGIQTYGFLPMQLPAECGSWSSSTPKTKRIPVDAVEFGTGAIRSSSSNSGNPRQADRGATSEHRNRASPPGEAVR